MTSRDRGRSERAKRMRGRGARPWVEALEPRRLMAVSISQVAVPAQGGNPLGITTGPDGNLWFAAGIDTIDTINPTTHQSNEYITPTPGAWPVGIVAGPDGNLWFTESGVGKIGVINPTTKVITEYPLPTPLAQPEGITVGPDGNLWFTESGLPNGKSQVGDINPTTHQVTEYPTPTAGADPKGITTGPDGNLWFTETSAGAIGRINPTTGVIAEFPAVPGNPDTGPVQITAGPDGRLWFTESSVNSAGGPPHIGAIDPTTLAITQIDVPSFTSAPDGITKGPDGNLWFADSGSGKIGMVNPVTLAVVELAASPDLPAGITVGPDGNLWVTFGDITETSEDTGASNLTGVGSIDPATQATAFYPYPTSPTPHPDAIVAGPDGNVWFTDDSGRVGQINPATRVITEVPFNVASNATVGAITVGPDDALWFTASVPLGEEEVNRIDPSTEKITTFDVGDFSGPAIANNVPVGITTGPDGNLWFAMSGGQIGEIDLATQAVSFYDVPNADPAHSAPSPNQITLGPDGNLWFTDQNTIGPNAVGTINPITHVITEFPLPDQIGRPDGIVAGPDGNLWFAEHDADKIGTINPATHQITEYPVPTMWANPAGIAVGPDGRIWFTEQAGNKIGSIDPTTHQIAEYPTPPNTTYPDNNLDGIAAGLDHQLYFAECAIGAIGIANLSAGLAAAPTLAAQSDTGVSQTDGITRDNGTATAPLVFTIPSAESTLDYRLYDVTNPDNPVLLAGPILAKDGTVTVSGRTLADGVHRIAYTSATGVNGTESALSAPTTITIQTSLTIAGTDPADGAVVTALPDGAVTITFSHPLAGLNPGGTALMPDDPHDVMLVPRGPGGTFAAPSGLDSGDLPIAVRTLYRVDSDGTSSITITPTGPLSADVFRIAVKLGDFTDLAGNPLTDSLGGDRTFLFQPAPVGTGTSPLQVVSVTSHNGTDVIANNLTPQPDTIAIHFNQPLYAGAAGGGNVELIANPGPHFTVIPAVAAYSPTTDSIELTPEVRLNPGTVYVVAVSGAVSDDQGYGGPGYPLGQTFYDSFTVSSAAVGNGTRPLTVTGTSAAPLMSPPAGTNWPNPVGYVSVQLTEPPDMRSLGRYSVMLIPRSGGTDGTNFDAADLPVNATVAFNPNTDQLIIVPSQPVGNDVYLVALSGIKATNGDLLLNNAGRPAGVNGNAPYYATFEVSVSASGNAAVPAVLATATLPTAPAPVATVTPAVVASPSDKGRSSPVPTLPAGPLRLRPAQEALGARRGDLRRRARLDIP